VPSFSGCGRKRSDPSIGFDLNSEVAERLFGDRIKDDLEPIDAFPPAAAAAMSMRFGSLSKLRGEGGNQFGFFPGYLKR
jgi:hypothetical protein